MRDFEAITVTKIFEKHWIEPFRAPSEIICDHGRQYTSSLFKSLCTRYEIKTRYTTPNNPTGNGMVERIHRTINEVMRIFKCGSSKYEIEKIIITRLNTIPHSTTKIALFTFQFGWIYGTDKKYETTQDLIALANLKST